MSRRLNRAHVAVDFQLLKWETPIQILNLLRISLLISIKEVPLDFIAGTHIALLQSSRFSQRVERGELKKSAISESKVSAGFHSRNYYRAIIERLESTREQIATPRIEPGSVASYLAWWALLPLDHHDSLEIKPGFTAWDDSKLPSDRNFK